jgi:hypothetical protein
MNLKIILALLFSAFLVSCSYLTPRSFDVNECDGDLTDPYWCGSANDGPSTSDEDGKE